MLRVRAFYRRDGTRFRRKGAGSDGDPHVCGKHEAPDDVHGGSGGNRICLHAVLRPLPGRIPPGSGCCGSSETEGRESTEQSPGRKRCARRSRAFSISTASTSTVSAKSRDRVLPRTVSTHAGLHVHEDYFYPEVLNPATQAKCADGETGELVFTTLAKEAMPLIRYRTKDLTSIDHSTCECGRTLPRISKFTGRTDDMKVIRGVQRIPDPGGDCTSRVWAGRWRRTT